MIYEKYLELLEALKEAGATAVMAEAFESSLFLGGAILRASGVPEPEIERVLRQFREEELPVSVEEVSLIEDIRELKKDKIRLLYCHDLPADPESHHLKRVSLAWREARCSWL